MSSEVKRVIGLMSGTSADGIDAALVEFCGHDLDTQVKILAHATYPYDTELREQILAACYPDSSSVDLICHLNVVLGHRFAEAAAAVAHQAGISLDQVHLIGSHGQTLFHIPLASTTPPRQASTLQIGEPCVIAERTGITTIADFRPRDMAAGGLGAPLSPYGHYRLFAKPEQPKLVQNIGGIANVTVLTGEDINQTIAFDTGPGNMLMDEAVRHFTDGQQRFDAEGRMAALGSVHAGLLTDLLQHPFIAQPPPKATGREIFGNHFFQELQTRAAALNLSPADVVSTCAAYTAESIRLNYQSFVFPYWSITEVIVCGGGAQNPVLMDMLAEALPSCQLTTPETYGYPNEALEAILFAILAHATLHGHPTNIPNTTGARHPVILGKIVPASGTFLHHPAS